MSAEAQFTFESSQWTRILKKLESKWEDIKLRKEFGGIISIAVYKDVMEHFDQEKGPKGTWENWTPLYEAHLQKIGRGGNKKLQFSGNLRQRFTPEKWKATQAGILFFNNAKTKSGYAYAQGHDQGGKVDGRPPARPFMWLSNKAIDSIVRQTIKWMKEDI